MKNHQLSPPSLHFLYHFQFSIASLRIPQTFFILSTMGESEKVERRKREKGKNRKSVQYTLNEECKTCFFNFYHGSHTGESDLLSKTDLLTYSIHLIQCREFDKIIHPISINAREYTRFPLERRLHSLSSSRRSMVHNEQY